MKLVRVTPEDQLAALTISPPTERGSERFQPRLLSANELRKKKMQFSCFEPMMKNKKTGSGWFDLVATTFLFVFLRENYAESFFFLPGGFS